MNTITQSCVLLLWMHSLTFGKCQVIKCKVLEPDNRGTRYEPASKLSFLPGASLTVACGDGYWISTPQQTSAVSTCKDDGQWTISPICQAPLQCGQPPYLAGGDTTSSSQFSYQHNERVEYNCQAYYVMEGQNYKTCKNGEWVGQLKCLKHQCKQLDLSNAEIISNKKDYYSKDEHVQYTCSNDPERKFTATCDLNGWTGILNCSECLQPEVLHGFVVGPLHDTVYYTCNQGFKLASKGWWGVAQCIDGQWFGLQECVANDNCVEMPVIAHATIKHQIKINGQEDSLQIMCKEGYQPQIDRLMCVKGKWDSNGLAFDSICTFVAGTCNPPTKIENAVISTPFQRQYLPDSKLTFKCREQYMMEGKDTSTCENGQWDIEDIKCIPYCSKPKHAELIMTFTDNKEKYVNGDVVEYNCINPGGKSGRSATCLNGMWSEPIKCEVKPCPIPEDTPNGNYQIIEGDDLVFGAIIKYFCNPGYQMVSKIDTRTCLGNKWSGHVPTCEPKRCPQPPEQDGITIEGLKDNEGGFLPQNFITFSCNDPGKQLIGRSKVVCGQDGLWEKSFPYCEDISCKVEALDPHLSVDVSPRNQAVRIGNKIRFRCSDEYALVGFEENECLPNGQWDKLFPTCTKLCQLTHIPATIRLDTYLQGTQARQGQKLMFSCHTRNQVLQGKAEVECLPNGQWSDPFPTCAGVPNLLGGLRCGQPPYLDGGDTTSSSQFSYQHNERVEYICKQYYVMEGRNYKTCENGEWVGQLKCLKPCTVNKELMSRHNIQFKHSRDKKIYSEHDDTIEFRCVWRRIHDGILSMRQKCIDGEIELPTCE
ncbi:complement factor H-related protein 5-like isoform X1 [Vanacampus margaritifer]